MSIDIQEQTSETAGPSIDLLLHQDNELFDRTHPLVFHCGGRGSGKSAIDYLHFDLRADVAVDQPYGLFASTDTQLQTFVSQITDRWDELGVKWVYGTRAPKKWRRRWKRQGVKVPAHRKRNMKFLIADDGTHIFTCSMINNAYTRAKSLDLLFALVEEATEPGVTKNALTTILGCIRCGVAKKDADGASECERRGHFHQMVVKFNVPLNDASHYIYRYVDELKTKEEQRKHEKKPPFFRLIESSTTDNPHTGEQYDERLRAAYDLETYLEQTSGKLNRKSYRLSYHAFSDRNILSEPDYIPKYRDTESLYLWCDFNATPAAVGFGQHLRPEEVPPRERHSYPNLHYFAVQGELFSGAETMVTSQVAEALLRDPLKDSRCVDCPDHCEMSEHIPHAKGQLCMRCSNRVGDRFCSGRVQFATTSRKSAAKFIHAPPNWRGLVNHRGRIYVYGDANDGGVQASSADGDGSHEILRGIFSANLGERVYFRFKDVNPPVNMRVLAMNAALEDGRGVRQLFFAPWCAAHLRDMREVVPDPKKNGHPLKMPKSPSQRRKDDTWLLTDMSDALGYFVEHEWPVKVPKFDGLHGGGGTDQGPFANDWPRP